MIIDFKARRTTLVASPVDGRSGIPTLTTLAESLLGIPITKGEDYVVFVSRSRKVCKIVFWDERGACMVVRRLNDGRFARFLMRASGPAAAPITPDELAAYLDGEDLQVERRGMLKNCFKSNR